MKNCRALTTTSSQIPPGYIRGGWRTFKVNFKNDWDLEVSVV